MAYGSPGAFPVPPTGAQYLKFRQLEPDFGAVTDSHTYEDGGKSWVARNDSGPTVFLFEYDGLTVAQAAVFLAHHSDAGHELFGFNFTNPRTAAAFTDVHYMPDGWEEDHDRPPQGNYTIISLRIKLVKYPT